MEEMAANHRLHNHYPIPQPAVQGRRSHPKTRKKKSGIKVHTVIHVNEGVPSDIKFTSAATNDSFMLKPASLEKGDIMDMDLAYIDYEKFRQLTERGVIYAHKLIDYFFCIVCLALYGTTNPLSCLSICSIHFWHYHKLFLHYYIGYPQSCAVLPSAFCF